MVQHESRIDINDLPSDAARELTDEDLRKVTGGDKASRFIRISQPYSGAGIAIETLEIAHEGIVFNG